MVMVDSIGSSPAVNIKIWLPSTMVSALFPALHDDPGTVASVLAALTASRKVQMFEFVPLVSKLLLTVITAACNGEVIT